MIDPALVRTNGMFDDTYVAKVFIDATYEGDSDGQPRSVSYTVGREANSKYGETLNGVQRAANTHSHRFIKNVDPFVKPGDPKSGLLFGIDKDPLPKDGEGDNRLAGVLLPHVHEQREGELASRSRSQPITTNRSTNCSSATSRPATCGFP